MSVGKHCLLCCHVMLASRGVSRSPCTGWEQSPQAAVRCRAAVTCVAAEAQLTLQLAAVTVKLAPMQLPAAATVVACRVRRNSCRQQEAHDVAMGRHKGKHRFPGRRPRA